MPRVLDQTCRIIISWVIDLQAENSLYVSRESRTRLTRSKNWNWSFTEGGSAVAVAERGEKGDGRHGGELSASAIDEPIGGEGSLA